MSDKKLLKQRLCSVLGVDTLYDYSVRLIMRVTKQQLCDLLEISERTLERHISHGLLRALPGETGRRQVFNLAECAQEYVQFLDCREMGGVYPPPHSSLEESEKALLADGAYRITVEREYKPLAYLCERGRSDASDPDDLELFDF